MFSQNFSDLPITYFSSGSDNENNLFILISTSSSISVILIVLFFLGGGAEFGIRLSENEKGAILRKLNGTDFPHSNKKDFHLSGR